MSKEQFVIDVLFRMRDSTFKLKHVDLSAYGITRATAWRSLKELEKCGYIQKAIFMQGRSLGKKSWKLTEMFQKRFNQFMLKDSETFFRDLDRVLVFNDPTFQQQIRERVHKLVETYGP